IYFMRFRDMTMFFGVLLLGTLCSAFSKRINFRKAGFYILLLIMLAVVVVEWETSRQLKRAYPEGMKYTADLIQFLRKHDLSGKIVLTDMQNSAMLKSYTDASILIQAKYELPAVRQLTREYLTSFFNAPLEEFAEFCDQNDVDYLLIHLPIITTPAQEPYSYRYMVCANTLKADSAAVRLGMKKGIEKNFYEITLPDSVRNINGYRLYKFIPNRQIEKAEKLSNTALKNYSKNPRSSLARRQIRRAYRMAPGPGKIYENYAVIRRAIPPEIKLKKRSAAQR
ncbi:MAG: hypothetical protein J6S19_07675, partial [Lentisphaeria bacterium]|nr:hypothetical protein [Lentisphaeria bacterium]